MYVLSKASMSSMACPFWFHLTIRRLLISCRCNSPLWSDNLQHLEQPFPGLGVSLIANPRPPPGESYCAGMLPAKGALQLAFGALFSRINSGAAPQPLRDTWNDTGRR